MKNLYGILRTEKAITKVQAVIIAIIIVVAAIAGVIYYVSLPPSRPTPTLKEIHVYCRASPPESDAWTKAAEYFNEKYSKDMGFKIVIDPVPHHGYLEMAISTLLSKSPSFDLMLMLNMYIGEFAEAGVIEPLDHYLTNSTLYPYDLNDFLPASLESVRYKGKIYALPCTISTMFLYYRKDLISKPPDTWDEYFEVAKNFTSSYNPNSPTQYGTTTQAKRGECLPKEWYQYFWSFGGEFFENDWIPSFNSSAGVKSLEFQIGLFKAGVVPPDVNMYAYSEVMTALQGEITAMAIQWDAAYYYYTSKEYSPKIWDKVAIAPLPGYRLPDGTIRRAHFVHTWTFVLNAYSQNKEEAFKAMAWLTSTEGAIKYAAAGGTPVPRVSVFTAPELADVHPEWPLMSEVINKYGKSEIPIPEWATIHEYVNIYLSLAWAGKLTPKDALDALNSSVYELLKERGYYG